MKFAQFASKAYPMPRPVPLTPAIPVKKSKSKLNKVVIPGDWIQAQMPDVNWGIPGAVQAPIQVRARDIVNQYAEGPDPFFEAPQYVRQADIVAGAIGANQIVADQVVVPQPYHEDQPQPAAPRVNGEYPEGHRVYVGNGHHVVMRNGYWIPAG